VCSDTGRWLLREARDLPSISAVVGALARRLTADGFHIHRLFVTTRTLHPQVLAIGQTWNRGDHDATEMRRLHGVLESAAYLDSPVRRIFEGEAEVRRRLDRPGVPLEFPILEELRAEGVTEYIALPLPFSQGRMNVISVATDRPGGFRDDYLLAFRELLPLLALVIETKETRRMTGTLLETYLGRDAGQRVLNGAVKRGDVVTLAAALWYCDLRGFTTLSERLPREQVIALLNDYFSCMAGPVHAHGGDVLKFIGDAMLAIFPIADDLDRDPACERALKAAKEALRDLEALNARRREQGETPIESGLALHRGTVMYGNIGAPDRLDFTVIGPAVNLVARLEPMCKPLGRRLLASASIAEPCGSTLVSIGTHTVRGFAEPLELFTLPDD
jgi:adenylate cyclase